MKSIRREIESVFDKYEVTGTHHILAIVDTNIYLRDNIYFYLSRKLLSQLEQQLKMQKNEDK